MQHGGDRCLHAAVDQSGANLVGVVPAGLARHAADCLTVATRELPQYLQTALQINSPSCEPFVEVGRGKPRRAALARGDKVDMSRRRG